MKRSFSILSRRHLSTSSLRSLTSFPFKDIGCKSKPPVVLVAGFPDDQLSAWHPKFLAELQISHRIIALCLPGYDSAPNAAAISWGFDFEQLISSMNSTLDSILSPEQTFHLIGHDWGSVVAQFYQNSHPNRINRLVLLDVGQNLEPSSMKEAFVISFYQIWFAASFVMAKLVHTRVADLIFKSFFVIMPRSFNPTPHDYKHRPASDIHVGMCYPYYHMWRGILTGKSLRPRFPSQTPTLFIYGARKNCMFHGPKFLRRLEKSQGAWLELSKAGHWVTHFEPEICAEQITKFFSQGEGVRGL